MIALYNVNKIKVIKEEYQDRGILIDSETFNREAFDAVLAQQGCVGVRLYLSMDESLSLRTIVIGVNADNQDIIPVETQTTDDPGGVIVEDGKICPPDCPTLPPLTNP